MTIALNNVSFSYDGEHRVLNSISAYVTSGQLLAVVGPSGCGKSTLLRCIAGLLPRQGARRQKLEGAILLEGQAPSAPSIRPGTLALMFQEPVLLPNRTVERNISLPLEMIGSSPAAIRQSVPALLEQIGLTKFRHLRPSQLSVGMKSRVALAMTFVTNPKFLLLDEPFSSLDLSWRLAIYRALTSLRNIIRPTTVMVTHDLREAILLADTIAVLSSRGDVEKVFSFNLAKPVEFSSRELASYGHISLDAYSQLEAALLGAAVY